MFPDRHAALLAGLTFLPLALSGCRPDSALKESLERLAELDAEMDQSRGRYRSALEAYNGRLALEKNALAAARMVADQADAATEVARLELASLEEEFATYRNSYRNHQLGKLDSHVFPDVVVEGRKMRNFRVTRIGNEGLRYMYSGGTGELALSGAPVEVAQFLRLDEAREDGIHFPAIVSGNLFGAAEDVAEDVAGERAIEASRVEAAFARHPSPGKVEVDGGSERERLEKRRDELRGDYGVLGARIDNLRRKRSGYRKAITERGSFQAKRALRASDESLDKLLELRDAIKYKIAIIDGELSNLAPK